MACGISRSTATVAAVLPLRFVPYHELGDRPNVVVDGAAAPSTVLTLSHWPGSPTPPELLDDLSAQIAFHTLAEPERFAGVDLVSNNHFDQDGLVSAFRSSIPMPRGRGGDRSSTWPAPATSGRSSRATPSGWPSPSQPSRIRPGHRSTPTS